MPTDKPKRIHLSNSKLSQSVYKSNFQTSIIWKSQRKTFIFNLKKILKSWLFISCTIFDSNVRRWWPSSPPPPTSSSYLFNLLFIIFCCFSSLFLLFLTLVWFKFGEKAKKIALKLNGQEWSDIILLAGWQAWNIFFLSLSPNSHTKNWNRPTLR